MGAPAWVRDCCTGMRRVAHGSDGPPVTGVRPGRTGPPPSRPTYCPTADLNRVRPRAARADRPAAAPDSAICSTSAWRVRSMAEACRLASSCSLAATGVSATRARSRVSSAISLTTTSCSSRTASSLRARTSRWWASLQASFDDGPVHGRAILRMRPVGFPPEIRRMPETGHSGAQPSGRGQHDPDAPTRTARRARHRGPGATPGPRGTGSARRPVAGSIRRPTRVRPVTGQVGRRRGEVAGEGRAGQRGQGASHPPGVAGLEHPADPPRDARDRHQVDDVERGCRCRRGGPA